LANALLVFNALIPISKIYRQSKPHNFMSDNLGLSELVLLNFLNRVVEVRGERLASNYCI
jgi:hypothetical protein